MLYSQVCLRICSLKARLDFRCWRRRGVLVFLLFHVTYFLILRIASLIVYSHQSEKKTPGRSFLFAGFIHQTFTLSLKGIAKWNNPLSSNGKRTDRQKYRDISYFFKKKPASLIQNKVVYQQSISLKNLHCLDFTEWYTTSDIGGPAKLMCHFNYLYSDFSDT